MTRFDMLIIGGGPAGVTAALRARELGARVALVERRRMGGTCTNDGCIPTRVLAKAARLKRDSEQFATYGLDTAPLHVDFPRLMARVNQVIEQVHDKKQLLEHLRDVQVSAYEGVGNAHFRGPNEVVAENGERFEADHIVICAGGHARRLDFPGTEHALNFDQVWSMRSLPKSLVVVGGGATGCQLASIFADFGARVTLMDVAPQLLIAEDISVAQAIADQFTRGGIEVITGIEGVKRLEPRDGGFVLTYGKDGQEHPIETEAVILSVGWPGNLEPLNLAAAGVRTRGPYIEVNDALQTSVPHIFAAGDINGRLMLVQTASHQARTAVENALLGEGRVDELKLVPHGGFTDPEYASVGLTEKQAREQYDCAIHLVPYADTDRAVIDDRRVGFCKLIVDRKTRLVVGAHVVGEQAVEVVHIVAAGMAGGLRVEQFANLEIAYPTFAAVIGLAARQLARDLEAITLAPEWRSLKRPPVRAAEWERADSEESV